MTSSQERTNTSSSVESKSELIYDSPKVEYGVLRVSPNEIFENVALDDEKVTISNVQSLKDFVF